MSVTEQGLQSVVDELDWPATRLRVRNLAHRFRRRRRLPPGRLRRVLRPPARPVRRHRRRVGLGQERDRAVDRRARGPQRRRRGGCARDPPRGRPRASPPGSGAASGAATSGSCCRMRWCRSTRCAPSAARSPKRCASTDGETGSARRQRVLDLLTRVGVPLPQLRARQRPDQLSGGLRQRALIASAIALDPDIVIADEPTTALDVTVQAQVLVQLERMKERGASVILISHDLSVVARLADHILVMRGGEVLEQGPIGEVLGAPQHDYTRALIAAVPSEATRGRALTPGTEVAAAPVDAEPGRDRARGHRPRQALPHRRRDGHPCRRRCLVLAACRRDAGHRGGVRFRQEHDRAAGARARGRRRRRGPAPRQALGSAARSAGDAPSARVSRWSTRTR